MMKCSLRLLARGGATAALTLFAIMFLFPTPVALAQDEVPPVSSMEFDAFTICILLLAVACAGCFIAGVMVARRPRPGRHYPGLIMGLGDAAFLVAIIGTFGGMREAFGVVASMGAAVTPADLADGLSRATDRLALGAWVALGALVGAGLLRWRQRRPGESEDAAADRVFG